MDEAMKCLLRKMLIKHEGNEKFPYVDTVGKITIGIGRNLSDRGISDELINDWFNEDVDFFYRELKKFPFFDKLNEARQIALIDMSFMGMRRLNEFKRMLAALSKHDYVTASKEMLDSKWADQVKGRAIELAEIMKTGVIK